MSDEEAHIRECAEEFYALCVEHECPVSGTLVEDLVENYMRGNAADVLADLFFADPNVPVFSTSNERKGVLETVSEVYAKVPGVTKLHHAAMLSGFKYRGVWYNRRLNPR